MDNQPLLQITLDDINSIPEVYYKGEKITKRIKVSFDWETKTDQNEGGAKILIEHAMYENAFGHKFAETISNKLGEETREMKSAFESN
ncbi:hypothetical protein P8860_21795 [Bacillus spizizenii]|uniref:Uncharacterized protein n=1 Tax=Bacillus spizizenii TaxID=96241 RepID=A0A9Q4HA55_BACSC|nr:hypothetical protein [Bacillus spizizenii]MEC0581927.1 hypothetical protein [Bacillus spizizenii]MEC0631890.1 hypothetical protein [Bacillus spizizenii]